MPRKKVNFPVATYSTNLSDPELEASIKLATEVLAAEIEKGSHHGNPITLGPRVASAEKQAKKLVDRASAASAEWFENVQHPKKNALIEGVKAEGKYADKMRQVIASGSRAKALGKVSDEDLLSGILAAGSGALADGVTKKAAKIARKRAVMQPLQIVLAQALDKLPTDTDSQRAAKMAAARKGMIAMGKVLRGEASPQDIVTAVGGGG